MPSDPAFRAVLADIEEAIRGIRFGTVQITIHDSRVVQIEKAEKIRVCHEADRTTGGSQPSGPSGPKEDQWNVGSE
ncbi:MAG: YezD family protein [Candidatus Omnitrophica bacterium]|nr:YezD family protein [Candidatus Omnitrophota bacterium]